MIIPPLTSAAAVLEGALERRDSQMNGTAACNGQMAKKGVKTRRKGSKSRPRPRSHLGVNGLAKHSSLNLELSKTLASLKHVKSRSDSDPMTIDIGRWRLV